MTALYKITRAGSDTFKERLTVKTFRDADAAGKFLCTGENGLFWKETHGNLPTKAGVYAKAGGEWRNVRTLDPCVLAHI